MKIHCQHHPDVQPCATKMGQEAAAIVAKCKTAEEAAQVAVDSMRTIARAAGAKMTGPGFAGVTASAAKSMPDVTVSEVEAEVGA